MGAEKGHGDPDEVATKQVRRQGARGQPWKRSVEMIAEHPAQQRAEGSTDTDGDNSKHDRSFCDDVGRSPQFTQVQGGSTNVSLSVVCADCPACNQTAHESISRTRRDC